MCCAAGYFTEWSYTGIIAIMVFHVLRERPLILLAAYEAVMLFYFLTLSRFSFDRTVLWMMAAVTLPVLVITFFYNGKKGRFPVLSKYFFYIFYPAHLLLIFLVKLTAA